MRAACSILKRKARPSRAKKNDLAARGAKITEAIRADRAARAAQASNQTDTKPDDYLSGVGQEWSHRACLRDPVDPIGCFPVAFFDMAEERTVTAVAIAKI